MRKSEQIARELAGVVAPKFDTNTHDVMSRSRRRERIDARQMVFYYLNQRKQWGPTKTARAFPIDFDHSTVIHGCKAVQNMLDTDSKYAEMSVALFEEMDSVFDEIGDPFYNPVDVPPLHRVSIVLYPEPYEKD